MVCREPGNMNNVSEKRPVGLFLRDSDGSIYRQITEALAAGVNVKLLASQPDYVDRVLEEARKAMKACGPSPTL